MLINTFFFRSQKVKAKRYNKDEQKHFKNMVIEDKKFPRKDTSIQKNALQDKQR